MNKKYLIFGIIFVMLVSFTMVNATMYDKLQSLEGKNCRFQMDFGKMFFIIPEDLMDRFGLVPSGGDDCVFVFDYLPYSQSTLDLDLLWWETYYAEIGYRINDSTEYLFILGKNSSTFEEIADIVANYDDYQYYLITNNTFSLPENFWDFYDPDYTGPPDEDCVDNEINNVYLGNQGSYQDNGLVEFNSYCYNSEAVIYPYCEGETLVIESEWCACDDTQGNGKCIANTALDVFEVMRFYTLKPSFQRIDADFVISSVISWIENGDN